MLEFSDVVAYIEGFTYKPGWHVTPYLDEWEGPYFHIVFTEDDSFNPGTPLGFGSEWFPSPNDLDDEQCLDRALVWRIKRIEVHECLEFAKRDGKPIFNPHQREIDRQEA